MRILPVLMGLGIATLRVTQSQAEVSVLFFEEKDANDRSLEFEENGRFSHVAISYRGMWLHATSRTGVELTPTPSGLGRPVLVLHSPANFELSEARVNEQLKRIYDDTYRSTNCRRLLRKDSK